MNRSGQEIAYCSACSTRVRGLDFEKGGALRVLGRVFCSGCRPQTAPAKVRRVRRWMFRLIRRS